MNCAHWCLDTSDLRVLRTVTSHGGASVLVTEAPAHRWEDALGDERLLETQVALVVQSYLAQAEDDLDL